MKKGLILTVFLSMCICSFIHGQLAFGVSTGVGLNSAYFGLNANNKFVPYLSVQFLSAGLTIEENGQRYDSNTNQIVSYEDSDKISGSLVIPSLGAKYFIKQQDKLRAYLSLSLAKPLALAKLTNDDVEDEEFAEDLKNFSLWGGELGFGVEFFFDESFSLGGEFGLRHINLKYTDTFDREIFDPNTGSRTVEIENIVKSRASPTFSKISLNYYFSKKSE